MIRLGVRFGKVLLALGAAASLSAAAPGFDPKPWLEDLAQAKTALGEKYANLEWAAFEREADLPRLFAEAHAQIAAASSDAEARAAFDRIARRLRDGHVEFRWPEPAAKPDGGASGVLCARLGYNADVRARAMAEYMPGYSALQTPQSDEFPAGLVDAGGKRVGVLEIPLFSAVGWPELCHQALTALAVPLNQPCDDDCSDRVELWAEQRLTRDLAAQVRALKTAGAEVLAVDITGNGGGSEWAEAAARMLTPIRLSSERDGFVRGEHWVSGLTRREAELRKWAARTTGEDHSLLLRLADAAAADRETAATPCDGAPIWRGQHPTCQWLGEQHSKLRSADPSAWRDKPWGSVVFDPVKYRFDEGVWRSPLVVVVDGGTASASEEFASVLQDNKAAVIMGSPTYGAGCGHTDGGTPTTLTHSGGVLMVPDCVRWRADGSNEVMGVQPDVLVGFRTNDGPHRRAQRFAEKLPAAAAQATALWARGLLH
jgi:hypothetical protein